MVAWSTWTVIRHVTPRWQTVPVSFDLAIWEGERPADDVAAGSAFDEMFQRYDDEDPETPATDRIAAYCETLTRRWPDDDTAPWSVSHSRQRFVTLGNRYGV